MTATLSCPRCGASGIPLDSSACPACAIGFTVPVAQPTFVPPAAYAHAVEVQYASIGRRFVAGVIDTLLLAVPLGLLFGFESWTESGTGVYLTFDGPALVEIAAYWLYSAAMESSSRQATLGQQVMGLRVVADPQLEQVSFARATGRHFASYVSMLLLFIGYLMIAFTTKRQGLHDIMAGTVVVRDGGPTPPLSY